MRSLLPSLIGAAIGGMTAFVTATPPIIKFGAPALEECAAASMQAAGPLEPERWISRPRALANFYEARRLRAEGLPVWRIAISINGGLDQPYAPPLSAPDLQKRMKRCDRAYVVDNGRPSEDQDAAACYAAASFGYFTDTRALVEGIEARHPENADMYAAIARVGVRQARNDDEIIASLNVLGNVLLAEPLDLTLGRCWSRQRTP